MSRNTEVIEEPTHLRWFERTLASPNRLLLIGQLEGDPFGMVRFDRQEFQIWEVSILVAAQARGKGYSKILLRKALDYFYDLYPQASVRAIVKKDNLPSRSLFFSLRFVETGPKEDQIDFLLAPDCSSQL